MKSPVRAVVWLSVILASVGVGWYISQAPASSGAAGGTGEPGKYLFIAGGADPYWQLCVTGAKATAKELGAEIEVLTPTGEGEEGLREQLHWLNSIDAEEFDGVAIGPIDPDRQTTQINSVAEKTTLVTVDSDAPASRRLFYIGSSNYEAGIFAAQMVKEAAPDGGKVVVLLASLAKTNAAERKQGFDEELLGLAEDDEDAASEDAQDDQAQTAAYEIVATLMDQGDPEICRENVRKVCGEHPDLVAVVGTFGYHGPIALETLEELDRSVKVIAFDEHEKTLSGVESGAAHATIVQDPYGFGSEAIRILEKVRSGSFLSLPVGATVDVRVHCTVVKQDTLEDFKRGLHRVGESSQW